MAEYFHLPQSDSQHGAHHWVKIFLFLLLSCTIHNMYAQPCPSKNPWEWPTHSNWFIGNGVKGKFAGGSLVISSMLGITNYEGVSGASDDKGKLLFLTNGRLLWVPNSDTTSNAIIKYTGLLQGNEGGSTGTNGSAAQGVLTTRHPLDTADYYIFTTDDAITGTPNGLNYFIFDRNGNIKAGPTRLGNYRTTEGIAATTHANGVDVWITAWAANENNFYSYRLTCSGLISTPVISAVAPNTGGVHDKERGGLAFTWDSKYFAQVHGDYSPNQAQSVSVYKFDNATGIISDPHDIADPNKYQDIVSPYDVLFSPDNTKLYVSTSLGKLCLFDLSSWNTAAMAASFKVIPSASNRHSAIEIGGDGNLYMTNAFNPLVKFTGNLNTGALTYSNVTGAVPPITNLGLPTMYIPPAEEPEIQKIGPFCISDPPVNISTLWKCSGSNAEDSINNTSVYSGKGITNSVIGIFDPSIAGTGTHMIIFKRCNVSDTIYITVTTCALNVIITSTETGCKVGSGTATATASSGTPPYSYLWSNGQTTSTATGLSAGTYSVTIKDATGLSKTQTVIITQIAGPTASITGSTPTDCKGATGTATAGASGGTPSYTYIWSNGQTTATATGLAENTYTLTVTDANGCTNTQTVNITSNTTLTLDASSTQTGCLANDGTAIAIGDKGTSPYTYNWSNGETNASISGLGVGTYTVVITDAVGCTKTKTVQVTRIAGPTINLTANPTTIAPGGTSILNASGGGIYIWTPDTTLSCNTCSNPIATPTVSTTYCVRVTDVNGCKDSACVHIDIEIPCEKIYIPGAFSPNGDDENDRLCLMGTNCIEKFRFSIYNRWGEKVFDTTDPGKCWDGTYRGAPLNTAVFVYYMKLTTKNGDHISGKGNISLIR